MRQLNYDLKRLQDDARHGSFGTRTGRSFALAQMANSLHELGYRRLRATGLKGKHVEALVREWKRQGLSIGTIKNRMAHLRWWANAVGKPNLVRPDNASYGIGDRQHVTNENRGRDLPPQKLALVQDGHVRMALRLEEAFGLRREEAIKFSPSYADRGSKIVLKASTTKGGRPREIPVLTDSQRRLLDEARDFAGGGAMIPGHRNYKQQLDVYERQTKDGRTGADARPAPRVGRQTLRGDHRVEAARGGRAADAQPEGREEADRQGGAADDLTRDGTRQARYCESLHRQLRGFGSAADAATGAAAPGPRGAASRRLKRQYVELHISALEVSKVLCGVAMPLHFWINKLGFDYST